MEQTLPSTTKRRKVGNPDPPVPTPFFPPVDDGDLWQLAELYAQYQSWDDLGRPAEASTSKRKRVCSDSDDRSQYANIGSGDEVLLETVLPGSIPSNPNIAERPGHMYMANPFIADDHGRLPDHPRLTSFFDPVVVPDHLSVNGLIKFHLHFNDPNLPQKTKDVLSRYRSDHRSGEVTSAGNVPYLPREFGRSLNLDDVDMRLFKFYLVAFCAGRTLLETSNVYLRGIPAIAEKSECVRHAMLSFSVSYVLDYAPTERLKRKATFHHRRAVALLGAELNRSANFEVGNEEPLLMALSLLNHEDTVNWETRESTKRNPKWYQGAQAAKTLLDMSDPGYSYRHPMNVQSTSNRYYMGQYQMKRIILSDTCAPLEPNVDEHAFKWLLEGNDREVRRITGLAGCCAKILHTFSQITRLCQRLQENPESLAVVAAGKIILERLENFQQWSDLADSFATSEELFEVCKADQDEHGKVQTPALSVALNGEAHVQSAQIYLLCRLFRRPRSHPEVQRRFRNLLKCTDWVPLEGPLYTAQDSTYGFAMAGLVAVKEEDRDRLRTQFGPLEVGSRGTDVPVCRTLERLWLWLDVNAVDDAIEERPLKDRFPWWEAMTEHIFETEGRLNML